LEDKDEKVKDLKHVGFCYGINRDKKTKKKDCERAWIEIE